MCSACRSLVSAAPVASSAWRAPPGSRVLFLVVELCALCFRKNDFSKSNIVATALFGDGAAGMILSDDGEGPRLGPAGEHTWPQSLDIMGWEIEDEGLKALFSRDIPALVRGKLRGVAETFLARHGLALDDIDAFVCHPGGAKVLAALQRLAELLYAARNTRRLRRRGAIEHGRSHYPLFVALHGCWLIAILVA